jgi:hypothetical protein
MTQFMMQLVLLFTVSVTVGWSMGKLQLMARGY